MMAVNGEKKPSMPFTFNKKTFIRHNENEEMTARQKKKPLH